MNLTKLHYKKKEGNKKRKKENQQKKLVWCYLIHETVGKDINWFES